jgi:serine/threonine protein kinase
MAPEVLKGYLTKFSLSYNSKADIWSMGVCLFEMLFGIYPYEEKNIYNLI